MTYYSSSNASALILPADLETVGVYLQSFRTFESIQVAGVALLCFDTLLTLVDEVNLIWRRKWNLSTILYFVTRYLAFVDTVASIYQWTNPNLTKSACNLTANLISYCYVVAFCIAQVILILRTYALCNRDKRILAGIICTDLACMATAGYYVARFATSLQYDNPVPFINGNIRLTCNLGGTLEHGLGGQQEVGLWTAYLFLFIAETIIMIVTVAYVLYSRGYGANRQPDGPLLRTIYRDGISFYVFLQAFSLINVIVLNVSSPLLKDGFVSVHRILHALLTARILLNIRQAASSTCPDTEVTISGFEAAPRIEMPMGISDLRNSTSSLSYELRSWVGTSGGTLIWSDPVD